MQFLDNSGLPLAAGRVTTYAAGTSTPLATYTDSTGGTPNTNPIILDSAGRGDIWLTQGTGYKFVVATTLSVVLYTVDNILIPVAPASAQLLPTGCTVTSSTATLTATNGASQIVASGFHAAGKIVLGVTLSIGQTFGAGNGLTGLSLGDPGTIDRYGSALSLTAAASYRLRFSGFAVFSTATDLTLSAEGGTFASTGQATATGYFMTLT
jgi:hypothetical protein